MWNIPSWFFYTDAATHFPYTRYIFFRLIDLDKSNMSWKEQIMKLVMYSSQDSC
jgi:hypothetical protein